MATNKVVYFLCLTFTVTECYIPKQTKHAPPNIIGGTEDVVVTAGNNLTIECQGTEPVTWTYDNNTVEGKMWSEVFVYISEALNEPLYKYRTKLVLMNASFVDTGFYYCCEQGAQTDLDNPLRASRKYVYVRDEVHLSASSNLWNIIQTKQYSTVIIPCRPSSPDVEVSLSRTYSAEESSYESFDPRVGFEIRIGALDDSFSCKLSRDGVVQQIQYEIFPLPTPTSVQQPHILAPNHTSVGEYFVLKCIVFIDIDVYFDLSWEIPDPTGFKTGRIIASNASKPYSNETGESTLNITRVQMSDNGEYICHVKDHVNNTNSGSKYIMVLRENDSFIHITEEYGIDNIEFSPDSSHDKHVQWNIKVTSHPVAKIILMNNKNHTIEPSMAGMMPIDRNKYFVLMNEQTVLFRINNVELEDSGTYTITAFNNFEEKHLHLTLTVRVKPTVDMESDHYHPLGEDSEVTCKAVGYPLPTITWYYKPCLHEMCSFETVSDSNYTLVNENSRVTSKLSLLATQSGYVKCQGSNAEGSDSNTIGFFVTDIEKGFNVWGLYTKEEEGNTNAYVAEGDTITVHCGASIHNYTDKINWIRRNSENIENTDQDIVMQNTGKITIEKNRTEFTNRVSMTIHNITKAENGLYICRAVAKDEFSNDGDYYLNFIVQDPKKPMIYKTNMNNTELKSKLGKPLKWECKASGIPVPTITWMKDNHDWSVGTNYSRVELLDDNTIMSFSYTQPEDEGVYTCKATNRIGLDERRMKLMLNNEQKQDYVLICSLAVLTVLFVFIVGVLYVRVRKERRLQRELKKAGLINFEKGALDSLNPDLGVDDQAELLPYDKKWEFPRDKLTLGKQLGSGAFGVVMKADAFGICEGESVTQVAVKMVKRNADCTYIKALASELKIMVHLGKNLNVVNLLGACTKNVAKRELLVIVEYCRFGNLHNYLLRHREGFVNQIDPKTGVIDVSIGADILARSMSVGSTQSRVKYGALSFGSGNNGKACAGVDYRATPNPSSNETEITVCMTPSPTTGGEELISFSTSGTQQPEWRSNYRGDYNKGNIKPICTSELLCWAFQVARGMDYLVSRKVLHGDLAARNILLAEDNIVKICDFGLAKSMYKSENYKKKGDGPLPIKWMAIESIRDRVFSTQSDIWSYGIVLWEFFSLARTPYPGMEADERLYHKLVDGYRMDKPEYATEELYDIMKACWFTKPTQRPTFSELSEKLGNMLEETVRNHYIDLNSPYIQMNNQMFEEKQNDYLLMLGSPDYGNLASPQKPDYVNDIQFQDSDEPPAESSGYLCMKTSGDIFSPRPDSEKSAFDFDFHKKQKSNGEIATGIELLPMLHTNELSDSELSPTLQSPKSYLNPSYQKGLQIMNEPKKDIVKTPDNYINMPQQKDLMKNHKKSLTDKTVPNYKHVDNKTITDDLSERNYVNSHSRDWERPYVS